MMTNRHTTTLQARKLACFRNKSTAVCSFFCNTPREYSASSNLPHMQLVSALFTFGCILDAPFARRELTAAEQWVYARKAGSASSAHDQRATWPSGCTGQRQSPINVQSNAAIPSSALDGAIDVHINKHVPLLLNTGIYFELDKTTPEHLVHRSRDATTHATGDSKGWTRLFASHYNFYQVHWHAPSENRIDGQQFAMEAHYVHQLNDSTLVGTNARLAVIAVMYELSERCNDELDAFWRRMPVSAGDAPFDTTVDVGAWLATLLPGGFYFWEGSLTTPPCTEGVAWALLRRHSHVCARQVERLRSSLALMRDGVDVNNRVVQPLHGRQVRVTTGAVDADDPTGTLGGLGGTDGGESSPLRRRWGWLLLLGSGAAAVALWVVRMRAPHLVRGVQRPLWRPTLVATKSPSSSPSTSPSSSPLSTPPPPPKREAAELV